MTYIGILVFCIFTAVSFAPTPARAVGNDADLQCIPAIPPCPCGMIMGPKGCIGGPNKFMCPCSDTTSGFVTSGHCLADQKCHGESTGGMAPMLPMIPMPMPKMSMMMMPDPCAAGGATGSSSPAGCGGGYDTGSGSIFDTSAYFNAGTSDSGSAFDNLNKSTGGVSNFLVNATATAQTDDSGAAPIVPTTTANLTGVIRIGGAGATIVANLKDGVSEVAGFFGGNALNAIGAASVAGRLCATRPWAQSIISKVIPSAFFDGLCKFGGYQVGIITPQVNVGGTIKIPTTKQKPTIPIPAVAGTPSATIWAEPASVRLGTRTYIFWKSVGVIDCTVSGPNFSHMTLSGGASTVPLSGATTYSIECTAPDGSKVSDLVTVDLAI